MSGGVAIPLTWDPAGLSAAQKAAFPHLAGYAAFHLPDRSAGRGPRRLEGPARRLRDDGGGTPVDATGLQIPGVLDDLYVYDGPLGASFAAGVPTLRVWAPTARSVKLHLFRSSSAAAAGDRAPDDRAIPPPASGASRGEPGWAGRFYLYEVEVWTRATGASSATW